MRSRRSPRARSRRRSGGIQPCPARSTYGPIRCTAAIATAARTRTCASSLPSASQDRFCSGGVATWDWVSWRRPKSRVVTGVPEVPDFVTFYRAVHGREPFPWQRRLAAVVDARRVAG